MIALCKRIGERTNTCEAMLGEEQNAAPVAAQRKLIPSSPAISVEESRELFSRSSVDLSDRCLEKLPNLRETYPQMKVINLSRNRFKFINNLSRFPACDEINASFNALERFSSFLPISGSLKKLDVSHNVLSSCDNLSALIQLVWLNAAFNHIESLPLLDRFANLAYLDLSSNRLKALPNLSRLPMLTVIRLNDNEISTLNELHRTMPQCLQEFDIGGNVITDLREAQHLSCLRSIRSITFAENPCVRLEGRIFCYRPYLYCCCLELLQVLDGTELSETEIIKGEELHTHAKVRRMETHAQLCAYLEKECPEDCHHSFSSDDNRLMKILKKRREYALRLKDDTTSEESTMTSVSPYRDWLSKSATCIPSRIGNSRYICEKKGSGAPPVDLSDLSSVPAGTTPPTSATSNISSSTVTLSAPSVSCSTPVRHRIQRKVQNKMLQVRKVPPTPGTTPKRNNPVERPNINLSARRRRSLARNVSRNFPCMQKASTVCERGAQNPSCRIPTAENFANVSFVSARVARIYNEKEKKATLLIQSWWRGIKVRRMYKVPLLENRVRHCETVIKEKSDAVQKLEDRLSHLENCVEELKTDKERQALCILEMQSFITRVAATCDERNNCMLSKLLPVPAHLEYTRKSETEIYLEWRNSQCLEGPTGYTIIVDGRPCGTVKGIKKKAIVADLDPTKESVIRMRCVLDETNGNLSECLVIPPYKEDADDLETRETEETPPEQDEA